MSKKKTSLYQTKTETKSGEKQKSNNTQKVEKNAFYSDKIREDANLDKWIAWLFLFFT